MKWYSNLSKKKRLALLLMFFVFLVYVYAFYAEYTCVQEVFLNRIHEATKFDGDSTLLFLSQKKVLSPFAWFSNDVDDRFLAVTQQVYERSNIIIKQASDAYYYRDTSGLIGMWNSGFRDRLTNKYGIMINVGPIIWQSPFHIKVQLMVAGGPSHYLAFCAFTFNGIIWKFTNWEEGPMTLNLRPLVGG